MRYLALLSLVVMLVISPAPARAEEFTEGEYGFCLTGPHDRFDDAMVGYAPDFVVGNGHWHFDGDLPVVGCYMGVSHVVRDSRGTHSYVSEYWPVDQDTAMRLVDYKFGYCDGDDQFCGKNGRSSSGSTRNSTRGNE